MSTIIYQSLAHNTTARQAADEFARLYFSERRVVETFTPGGYFTLANGVATYRVVLIPAVSLVSAAVWQVERLAQE